MNYESIQSLFSVKNKVILVTGSNRGNGLAIAEGLRLAGSIVIRIDVSFDDSAYEDDYVLDLTNLSLINPFINYIFEKYGRIDSLINNAGVSIPTSSPYSDYKSYENTLLVNLHAAFELCCNVCPIMSLNNTGSIINITSLGAELGFPNNPSYQVSKAGLRQLTKAIARDWSLKNIRANNICPGYIKTEMTSASYKDPLLNIERQKRMLIKRWGESTDLIGAVIFLISEASSYITGSDIYVDGGWTSNGL